MTLLDLITMQSTRDSKTISLLRQVLRRTLHNAETFQRINQRFLPSFCYTLPVHLRQCDSLGQFKRLLKTHLFGVWDRGALWRPS